MEVILLNAPVLALGTYESIGGAPVVERIALLRSALDELEVELSAGHAPRTADEAAPARRVGSP